MVIYLYFLSVCIFLRNYVSLRVPNLSQSGYCVLSSDFVFVFLPLSIFTLERRSPCIFISLCIFHLRDASTTSSYVVFSPPQSASHNVARPTRKYCALATFYIFLKYFWKTTFCETGKSVTAFGRAFPT